MRKKSPPGNPRPKKATKKLTPERLLDIGVIGKPHGLKGALTIYSHTRPAIGITGYSFWYLGHAPDSVTPYAVRRCWRHGQRILAELKEVNDCNLAILLNRMRIWLPSTEVALKENEYLWADLVGCEVRRVDNSSSPYLGTVVAVEAYGAQDILVVRTPENAENPGEWMLPFVESVVLNVDMAARCINVDLPDGMDACFTPRF